jgi:hypothetical protein
MDVEAALPDHDALPLTGPRARAALQTLIARLSDAEAVALCQLILSWYPAHLDERTRNG